MAGCPANKPARSTSMPSRSHPLSSEIYVELNGLKSLLLSPPSANTVQSSFSCLVSLYDSMGSFLQLPLTQLAIMRLREDKSMEIALDNYVKLLDACSVVRETLLLTKEQSWAVHSGLRRRGAAVGGEADAYLRSRKKVAKDAERCMEALRIVVAYKKNASLCCMDNSSSEVVEVLYEVAAVSANTFKLFLSFLSSKRSIAKLRPNGWSAVSRAVLKGVPGQENCYDEKMNVLESADTAVCMIHKHRSSKDMSANMVQEALRSVQKLEKCVEELEIMAECVYRRIIQSRVSLLNILSN